MRKHNRSLSRDLISPKAFSALRKRTLRMSAGWQKGRKSSLPERLPKRLPIRLPKKPNPMPGKQYCHIWVKTLRRPERNWLMFLVWRLMVLNITWIFWSKWKWLNESAGENSDTGRLSPEFGHPQITRMNANFADRMNWIGRILPVIFRNNRRIHQGKVVEKTSVESQQQPGFPACRACRSERAQVRRGRG